jgi:hypothetical protein
MTGTAHVAEILRQHPEWDNPPRRLNLPLIAWDGTITKFTTKVDHIGPAAWKGDLSLVTVNLQTCWQRGFARLEVNPTLCRLLSHIQELKAVTNPALDILSPFGILLVKGTDGGEDESDIDSEEETHDITLVRACPQAADYMDGVASLPEVEDGVAAEEAAETLQSKFLPTISLSNGDVISKGKLLSNFMKYKTTTTSADRLKRYQNISHFESVVEMAPETRFEIHHGEPALAIGDPVVSILQCENTPFLCVAEVIDISVDSSPTARITVTMMDSDMTVMITYQLVKLVPATTNDDPMYAVESWTKLKPQREKSFSRKSTS